MNAGSKSSTSSKTSFQANPTFRNLRKLRRHSTEEELPPPEVRSKSGIRALAESPPSRRFCFSGPSWNLNHRVILEIGKSEHLNDWSCRRGRLNYQLKVEHCWLSLITRGFTMAMPPRPWCLENEFLAKMDQKHACKPHTTPRPWRTTTPSPAAKVLSFFSRIKAIWYVEYCRVTSIRQLSL